ncbi:alpha/beta fold hydrolase [Rapidithrix thailandica]|uniref:Alpha/beta fold hydrolase n=1 Tax=Rapidithrix thailandica TaxID=413964 RepID=A0AAW9S515_9BACT
MQTLSNPLVPTDQQNHFVYYTPVITPPKATILLIHGLNNPYITYTDWIRWFLAQGFAVQLVKLPAHRTTSKGYERFNASLLFQAIEQAYLSISVQPVILFGYSLGGLLGLTLQNTRSIQYDKALLFAPASATRLRGALFNTLLRILPNIRIRSASLPDYRHHNFVSIKAYRELFKIQNQLLTSQFEHLNQPTLTFIDPKDELISTKRLRQQIKQYRLSNWEIHYLNSRAGKSHHHLIVDKYSLGQENWKKTTMIVENFLKGSS